MCIFVLLHLIFFKKHHRALDRKMVECYSKHPKHVICTNAEGKGGSSDWSAKFEKASAAVMGVVFVDDA